MRFLMDLDDALHERDARQVIRLQKQYALDKEALEKKKALDDQTREQNQRDEIADIELKRQQRLEDARREYEQKLADQQVAKQRELEDLQRWRERELEDIQKGIQDKMETLLRGWVQEKKITESNAAQVYAILAKYFGPGGMTDALYKYMMQSMVNSAYGAMNAANGLSGYSTGQAGVTPAEDTSGVGGEQKSMPGRSSTLAIS